MQWECVRETLRPVSLTEVIGVVLSTLVIVIYVLIRSLSNKRRFMV